MPPSSAGCSRAITNVGEVTGPRTSRPLPTPWVNVVLPAPSSPLSTTRSPGSSRSASPAPRSRIAPASGTSKMNVRSGRRSSTLGVSRRISRKPWRSQNRIVEGSSSRATTVRSSKPWAASTAASINALATPCPWWPGATPKRRRYIVDPSGSSTSAATSSPRRLAMSPPWWDSSSARSSSDSRSAAAGGSSGGRPSNAGSTTARTSAAASGPTSRTSTRAGRVTLSSAAGRRR